MSAWRAAALAALLCGGAAWGEELDGGFSSLDGGPSTSLGVSGDGLGVSGDGLGVSGDGLGVSGDGVGVSGDGVGVSGDGVGESGDRPVRRNFLIPALEAGLFNFGIFAFNNLASREPFAVVTWTDIRGHFDGTNGWVFDVDFFLTNQFGHPYQGSIVFGSARSSGLTFWQSSIYTFLSSMAWEYFFERDAPSINDQITTTLGGILLGEALHRTYRFLIDDTDGPPSLLSRVSSVFISPASAVNRWLLNDEVDQGDLDASPPFYAAFEPGVSLTTRLSERSPNGTLRRPVFSQGPQAVLGGELVYGAPGDPSWRSREPFSHFDLNVSVTFPGVPSANLYVRGLLLGGRYGESTSALRGLWGLFGLYDLGANNVVRVSSVGMGFGTTFQLRLSEGTYLTGTVLVAALGFAAAGALGLETEQERDYHIGPGVESVLEARLVRRGLGTLSLRAKNWNVNGGYIEPRQGSEWITYATLDLKVRLAPRVALGASLPLALRAFQFESGRREVIAGGSLQVNLSYMSDDAFGTKGP